LQGRKTYLAVAIGALYLAGVWAGCWEFDEKILSAVGLGGLAFLRAAMAKSPSAKIQEPEKVQTTILEK
jgi:hypothetical protein